MKYIFLYIISASLFSVGAFAQIEGKEAIILNKLYVAYGQSYNLKLDETYSRLPKNGFNHLFNLRYENQKNARVMNFQGSFMIGTLKTKGNNINIINDYAGNLKFRYLKKINNIDLSNLSVYVGGNLDFRADAWFPQNAELRYAWDINLGTGFSTSARYWINTKLTLQYDFDISLIGVLWRSHNNGQQLLTEEIQLENGIIASAFETPRFSNVINTSYIDNSFNVFYSVSKQTNIYYNFAVSYRHIKQPLIKKGYEFNNTIGIVFNF